jgi:RND family efflux transporter MFP subunit
VLIRLDDEDLRARLGQAQANLEAAKANAEQARIEFERVERLFQGNNASQIERERAETALKTAQAELARATQAHREGETVLEYATVTSPIDGTVIDKRVQAGDTVTPGQPLVELYDPDRMQLVASVRESLTQRLEVGQTIDVRVDALDRVCQGTISEIVPEAESASRTFSVKVTGPCPPGIYSGMFGRLLIPLDEQEVLVVPESAVRRVGQLDMVQILADGRLQRRAVQLGRRFGEDVEVLSGLRAGERVALPEGA